MPTIRHPEFRDSLEPTKYPFGDQAEMRNDQGDVILEGMFLDAHLYPIGGKERLYLSQVQLEHARVTITIGDVEEPNRATGTFRLPSPPSNVRLVDAYNRPAGILVSEPARLAILQSWGLGVHTFEVEQSEFAATCCMPTPEVGLRGILLEDGSLLTGPVWIIGDDGVVVRKESITLPGKCGQAPQAVDVIRVDVVGDPLFKRRLCTPTDLFNTPNPIRKVRIVNGDQVFECEPNELGNFTIQMNDSLAADTALRVHQSPDGLVFEVEGSVTTETTANA